MAIIEINNITCNRYEYPDPIEPVNSDSGYIVSVVDSLESITNPDSDHIYIVDGSSYVYSEGEFVQLNACSGGGVENVQLYGTWTGYLDELTYVDTSIYEQTDTGINIQNAPSDMLYFIVTITCDGNYGSDVDVTTTSIWSGASIAIMTRNYANLGVGGYNITAYKHVVRPQTTSDLNDMPSSQHSVSLKNSGATVVMIRSLSSYGLTKVMGGNYTVNVYAVTL